MCSKREEHQEEPQQVKEEQQQEQDHLIITHPSFVHHQNMGHDNYYSYTSSSSSEVSPILQHPHQQPWNILPQVFHHHQHTPPPPPDLTCFPAAAGDHNTYQLFTSPPSSLPSSSYGGNYLFNRRPVVAEGRAGGVQFAYEGSTSDVHNLRLISETLGQMVQPGGGGCSMPFGLHAEMGKMSAQEIMDAKALAASKSHSEAERRRRERINNHLAKLRSLLPSTTKTDKASLLAEVIQHVKELKRQTSIIAEQSPVPTETDELTIDNTSDDQGNLVIRASLCCDDRSDLLPDLIKTLKALRLRTLKAEITTLGGRMKNVLFITGDQDSNSSNDGNTSNYSINMIQEAFKAVMEKTSGDHDQSLSSSGSVKRQRTNNIVSVDHHHHRI